MIRKIMAENVDVKQGVKLILERIDKAFESKPETIKTAAPMLVAVSKTKPVELIADAYSIGQRHFGENYVKELTEKGVNPVIIEQCKDIKWHFIGHLQRNKINKVINVPGIYMIETIDSGKIADAVNKAWQSVAGEKKQPLKVLIQVNTSNEEVKNGVDPSEVTSLYRHIKETCGCLQLEGIMTIGRFGHDYTIGPNPDFDVLMKCHRDICNEFHLKDEDVHVSMGMSDDFEHAIAAGSSIVRVGSSIFGYRPKKNEVQS